MSLDEVSSTAGQMWRTRPIRPAQAPVAGVCAGLGRRYQVDPVVFRTAFLITSLWGIGLLAYIGAALIFPREQSRRPDGTFPPPNRMYLLVLGLVTLASTGPSGIAHRGLWPSLGLILLTSMLAGWVALHLRVPNPPFATSVGDAPVASGYSVGGFRVGGGWMPRGWAPTAPQTPPPYASPEYASAQQAPTQQASTQPPPIVPTPTVGPEASVGSHDTVNLSKDPATTIPTATPPAWDPLGAAPFAWDLPAPTVATLPVPPPRSRFPLTRITLGITLLAVVGAALASLAGATWLSPIKIGAIALLILGPALIIGAYLRRGAALALLTVPLIVFVLIGSVLTSLLDGFGHGYGEREYTVTNAAELSPEYLLTLGDLTVDLRRFRPTTDTTVRIENGVGTVRVLIPKTVPVSAVCKVTVGDADCPTGGLAANHPPALIIDATVAVGEVIVSTEDNR